MIAYPVWPEDRRGKKLLASAKFAIWRLVPWQGPTAAIEDERDDLLDN